MCDMDNDQILDLKMNTLTDRFLKICREFRYVIFSSLFTGLLCYVFVFSNKLLNHDELANLFGLGARISSGRWGLEILYRISYLCSLPWLDGILTLILITSASCLITRIFEIKQPLLQILLSSLIIAFPSLIGTFGYMFTSVCYGISFLLMVLSVYLITSGKKMQILPAILLFAFSVGIYQAYMAVGAALLVIYLIRETLYTNNSIGNIFKKGLYFVAFLLVSLVIYWGISYAFLLSSGEILSKYAQSAIPETRTAADRIKDCIFLFINVFAIRLRLVITPVFSQILHIFCLVTASIEILFWCCRKKNLRRIPMLLFLLAVYPLAVTSVLLVVELSAVHTLVLYSFATVYVLVAVILDGSSRIFSHHRMVNYTRARLMDLTLLAMACIICSNAFLANKAYLQLYLNNSRNTAFATSLLTQIQMVPEYEEDMPVVISGTYPKEISDDFSDLKGLSGIAGFNVKTYSYNDFLQYYIGTQLNFASEEDLREIAKTEEFREMPSYPNHGFIRVIDDNIVVKLPE